jgi:hypothetical protein
MKSFIVYAPPYDEGSAGIVALHKLAYYLMLRGEKTFIHITHDPFGRGNGYNKDWNIPILQYPDLIAVYPEITYGNPLGCNTVARIIMHVPGYWGGPTTFGNDVLWGYSDYWNKRANLNLPRERILTIPVIDVNKFPCYGTNRHKKYIYRGKGKQPDDIRVKGDNIVSNTDKRSFVEKLNEAEILYSYDNVSALNMIALLCGCPVVIIPDSMYSRQDIELLLVPGMGYGIEEEKKAKNTLDVSKIRDIFIEEEKLFQERLDIFIKVMRSM